MFNNIHINENELNSKLQNRMFLSLIITGFIANTVGFLSNLIMFGASIPTIVCGVCVAIIVVLGAAGTYMKKQRTAAAVIVLMFALVEFPLLFFIYGANMCVYFLLGIVALVIFIPRPYHVPVIIFAILIDVGVIVFYFLNPNSMEKMVEINQFRTLVCSYVISAVSVAVMLCDFVNKFILQRTQLLEASRNLERLANYDELTGVYNRGYLIRTLKQWMDTDDKHFLVALLDVDDFKTINDTYGHLYGDAVLIELARLMKKEICGKGIAGRYGGDEFMLVFENSDQQRAMDILEHIQQGLQEYSTNNGYIPATFSCGVEIYRKEDKMDELLRYADERLYKAKNGGKNCIIS